MPSLYLINPRAECPSYLGAEGFEGWGVPATSFVGDLATVTLAALAPPEFEVTICDEHLDPIDFETAADFVGITGKVNQWSRMRDVADAFRGKGKTVIVGGPYASLSPETVRPHCDVLVQGEVEEIAAGMFADLASGAWRDAYQGTQPDPLETPVPRWDLYPNDRALLGVVQATRSCPFECEFCDVITYLGRRQRRKPIASLLRELEVLADHGYRDVLFADDNLTVHRKPTKALLEALIAWNAARAPEDRLGFVAQVSIDAARDPELLDLCAAAGIHAVFIGIETPSVDALKEAKKRQNVGRDLHADVREFLQRGIVVVGGLIVGFDSDGPEIFRQVRDYVAESAIPLFTLNVLIAPETTPLHARLREADRLLSFAGAERPRASPWDTNVVPLKMSREKLIEGTRALGNAIYQPDVFGARMKRMIDALGEPRATRSSGAHDRMRPAYRSAQQVLKRLTQLNPAVERMCLDVSRAAATKPGTRDHVFDMLLRYAQLHYMYEVSGIWSPAASVGVA